MSSSVWFANSFEKPSRPEGHHGSRPISLEATSSASNFSPCGKERDDESKMTASVQHRHVERAWLCSPGQVLLHAPGVDSVSPHLRLREAEVRRISRSTITATAKADLLFRCGIGSEAYYRPSGPKNEVYTVRLRSQEDFRVHAPCPCPLVMGTSTGMEVTRKEVVSAATSLSGRGANTYNEISQISVS